MKAPVAVLVSRFPLVTETFILREIIEIVRQGQPVRLVPLLREEPEVVHREAEPWIEKALYTPFLSPAIVLANLRALVRQPGRYLFLLLRTLIGSARDGNLLLGTLAIFPKSVYLAERLAAERVSHVHAHFATHPTMAAYIISRLTGIPFSFTVHAHDIFLHQAMLADKLEKAAFVRCISHFNANFLTERYPSESSGKLHVIHVGVDPSSYTCDPPQENETRLLTVAAFKPYKGYSVLVEACRLLSEKGVAFRWDLIGDGPLFRDISRQILKGGLAEKLHLLGSQPQHVVTERLARATIFVLPSVVAPDGQMDGIPVALMEAMASGRPVIASSLSGVSELVEDGVSGLVVPAGDAEALAAGIQLLSSNPGLARQMGKRGRLKVEAEFDLQKSASELIDRFRIRAVHETPDSRVIEVRTIREGEPRDIVYKTHRSRRGESRPAAERARWEFEVLTKLQVLNGGCRVARPLHVDERNAVLTMESCRGTKLDELLRASRRLGSRPRGTDVELALHRTGSWLRAFQALTTEPASGGEVTEELVRRARQHLARSETPGERVKERMEALSDALIAEPPRVCGHHGDFWPGNLFIDSGAVTAIDFEGYRLGLPLEDVAYFLLHLEIASFRPSRQRRYAQAFLSGYLDGEPLDVVQFRFCRLAKALQLLGSVRGRRQRRRLLGACLHG